MATALQFIALWFRETFSWVAYFFKPGGLERHHLLCTPRAQVLRGVARAHTFASRAWFWNQI
jgi:hypothetical protein